MSTYQSIIDNNPGANLRIANTGPEYSGVVARLEFGGVGYRGAAPTTERALADLNADIAASITDCDCAIKTCGVCCPRGEEVTPTEIPF